MSILQKMPPNCISNSFFLTQVSAALLRARYFLFQKTKSMVSTLVLLVFGTAQSTYEIISGRQADNDHKYVSTRVGVFPSK